MTELTLLKEDRSVHFRCDIGKYHVVVPIVIAIEKTAHLSTMAVKVYYQLYRLLLQYLPYHVLYQKGLWLLQGIRSQPTSVQVEASKIAPVVSKSNPINVHHWEDVDVVPPEQKLYFLVVL